MQGATIEEGRKLFEAKKFNEAAEYFTKLVDKDPKNVEALAMRGLSKANLKQYE